MSEHKLRPLMTYTSDIHEWAKVEIHDRHANGHWTWGQGAYYDWCDINCTDFYQIVKQTKDTVTARFKNHADASAFVLKWT